MATYTKETALYDTGAISNGIAGAAQTASNYMTDVTGGGVFVHPTGDSSNGVQITDKVGIVRGGSTVAEFGASATIGKTDGTSGYLSIESDCFKAVSTLGDKYFEAGDLSGQEITLEREGTGVTRNFNAPYADTSIAPAVKVNGTAVTATWIEQQGVTLVQLPYPAPAAGAVVLITYTITSDKTITYFTAGTRKMTGYEGAFSSVLGEDCVAGGEASTAAGKGISVGGEGEVAVGRYNAIDASDIFQVGNGSGDSSRSNAFSVNGSGDATVQGDLTVGGNIYGALPLVENWSPSSGYSIASSSSWSAALGSKAFQLAKGTYIAMFGADFSSNASGYRMVQINTSAAGNRYTPTSPAVSGNDTRLMGTILLEPTATTNYYMYVFQNSGSTLTVAPWVRIIKIG